jgi:hypothetical protein
VSFIDPDQMDLSQLPLGSVDMTALADVITTLAHLRVWLALTKHQTPHCRCPIQICILFEVHERM